MNFVNRIIQTLKKPFPLEENRSGYIQTITAISVFVTLFLYVFKPFGIDSVESGVFLICLGFGISAFIASLFYEMVLTGLFRIKRDPSHFTFAKWILYVMGLILTISFANFMYIRTWVGTVRWEFLPDMIKGTFAIGIFPTVA